MALHYRPTKSGGRVVEGDSSYGAFRVEWDRDDKLLSWSHKKTNPAPRQPCRHLGEFSRSEECKGCLGRVRIKVFRCEVHGECSLRSRLGNLVACCKGCLDYAAA